MRPQTVTEPLGGHINLRENYFATTWHVNAVLASQSPHERTAALLNTPQLISLSRLFFSSKTSSPSKTNRLHISRGVKKTWKLYPVHAIKACRGSGGTAPLILNFCTVNVRLHSPANLPPLKNWIEGWLGPTASLVLEKRKISCPYRNSNPESSIPQPSH